MPNADEFLFLNTKKKDNDLYYGFAIGSGDVQFKGPFTQTDITINATTGKDTKLEIPLISAQSAEEVNFISFVSKEENTEDNFVEKSYQDPLLSSHESYEDYQILDKKMSSVIMDVLIVLLYICMLVGTHK